MPSRYTAIGLRNFGKWLYVVRNTSSLWPDRLIADRPQDTMISQRDLANWLLVQYNSGDEQFFVNIIKQTEKWRNLNSLEGVRTTTMRFEFALSLAKAEFLVINGARIDCSLIWTIHEVMAETINPFHHLLPGQSEHIDLSAYDDVLNAPKISPRSLLHPNKNELRRIVKTLYDDGLPHTHIAAKVGISRDRVKNLLDTMDEVSYTG